MTWPFRRPGPKRPYAGGDAAFETLVLPHLDSAHNVARWLVRDAALAEDVVQDAVVRALRFSDAHRGGDARAWLMTIVRNVAYDALAARRRQDAMGACGGDAAGDAIDTIADPAPDPEQALSSRQDHATLEAKLAALPIELREGLMLRELEGLSYKDIAALTGVPIGTVMSRLSRARRAMMERPEETTP